MPPPKAKEEPRRRSKTAKSTKTTKTTKTKTAKRAKTTPCVRRKVGVVMHEFKAGRLKVSTSDIPVTDRRQALAIAYSEARRKCTKGAAKKKAAEKAKKKKTSGPIPKECLQRHMRAVMHEMKAGTLMYGRKGQKRRVTSPMQALAMGYARARAECNRKTRKTKKASG